MSMLCVQVLSAARNPIVIGQALPVWLLVSDAIFLAITAGLVLWLRSGAIPEHLTHPIAAFAYMIAGLSAVASIEAQADPLPFYFAMVILAGSICFSFLALFPRQCFRPRTTVDSSSCAIPDIVAGTLYAFGLRGGRCTWVFYHAAQNP
jgi:hypothetical protein